MGVSGSGKTTVGRLLADRIGARFIDGDDFHLASNIEKMSAGEPLTDADRLPWLGELSDVLARESNVVLACSALKNTYREILARAGKVVFVYLKADRDVAKKRVADRTDHFASPALIESQFATLEEPDQRHAILIDASDSPERIASTIHDRLTFVECRSE